MTRDGLEYFDMYKSICKDRGMESPYRTQVSLRYRQRTIPGAFFTVFSALQGFIGRILLKSGQTLISLGERVAGFQNGSAGSAGICGVSGRNNPAQVYGGGAR